MTAVLIREERTHGERVGDEEADVREEPPVEAGRGLLAPATNEEGASGGSTALPTPAPRPVA